MCIVLVIVGALGMTLVHLAGYVEYTFFTTSGMREMRSKNARLFLGCFFYSIAFLSAVFAVTSPQLDIPQQDPELVLNNDYHQVADELNQSAAEKQPTYDEDFNVNENQLPGWLDGWKFTVFLAFIASLIVLCFNLSFLLWAIIRDQLKHYQGTLYEGDCDQVQRISTGFHLLINLLSTILLGSSNYGMVRKKPSSMHIPWILMVLALTEDSVSHDSNVCVHPQGRILTEPTEIKDGSILECRVLKTCPTYLQNAQYCGHAWHFHHSPYILCKRPPWFNMDAANAAIATTQQFLKPSQQMPTMCSPVGSSWARMTWQIWTSTFQKLQISPLRGYIKRHRTTS